jgi:hypothetical protein
MQAQSFSQNVTVPVPDCALTTKLTAERVEMFVGDCVFSLRQKARESV